MASTVFVARRVLAEHVEAGAVDHGEADAAVAVCGITGQLWSSLSVVLDVMTSVPDVAGAAGAKTKDARASTATHKTQL